MKERRLDESQVPLLLLNQFETVPHWITSVLGRKRRTYAKKYKTVSSEKAMNDFSRPRPIRNACFFDSSHRKANREGKVKTRQSVSGPT